MRSVILIGFMGAGKSTVGVRLAETLNAAFVDTDQYIEQREQKSISRLFAQEGEAYFRQAETAALTALLKESRPLVISCGGGMPLREENRRLLKELGMVVYLKVRPETVMSRLKGDTTRPLLQGEDSGQRIRTLMDQREAFYCSAADRIVDADESDPKALAEKIASFFDKF